MCIGIASCYGERRWGAPRSRAGGAPRSGTEGFHGAELGCDLPCILGSGFSTAHPHGGPLSAQHHPDVLGGAQGLWVPGTEPCWGGGLAVTPCPTGVQRFCCDIVTMICHCPPWYSRVLGCFKVCWVFFTPCLLLVSVGHCLSSSRSGGAARVALMSPRCLHCTAVHSILTVHTHLHIPGHVQHSPALRHL